MGDKIENTTSSSLIPTTKNGTKTQSMYSKTLSSLGNLIKLLPTGTLFVFQFLNPVLTNNGHCHTINKFLSGILLFLCGFSCAFSSFTDSYTGSDGDRHYAIVTAKELWPSPASDGVDLSAYKLRVGDFVHASVSVIVFAVLGLLDTNTVKCFYPEFDSNQKFLLQVLPTVIGVVSSGLFMIFPSDRHGIGYPTSADSNDRVTPQKSDV